jgi:hypothetical protein
LKVSVLLFAGIDLTLKLACATFGVWNGVEIPYKRLNITIRNEINEFSSKFESFSFAIGRDCFDAEIGLRYVRGVEWSGKSV